VSNNRFPILELLFDPKKEASRWKLAWQSCYAASQLNLQYNYVTKENFTQSLGGRLLPAV
jgi:hypothetical protein